MIQNEPRQLTSLDEARLIIATLDNKVKLQSIKINSLRLENDVLLQDNFLLYEYLVRELSSNFNSEHIVELINMYKLSSQKELQNLKESKNKAEFFERQRDIYSKAFDLAEIEDKTNLLIRAEKEIDDAKV